MHKVAHADGELGTSRAAAATGIAMGLSAYATTTLEDVIAVENGNLYFIQVNFLKNRDIMRCLLSRAEGLCLHSVLLQSLNVVHGLTAFGLSHFAVAGYKAILLTVDAPMYGTRWNEGRNSFGLPKGLEYPNIAPGIDLSDLSSDVDPLAYGKERHGRSCVLPHARLISLTSSIR